MTSLPPREKDANPFSSELLGSKLDSYKTYAPSDHDRRLSRVQIEKSGLRPQTTKFKSKNFDMEKPADPSNQSVVESGLIKRQNRLSSACSVPEITENNEEEVSTQGNVEENPK